MRIVYIYILKKVSENKIPPTRKKQREKSIKTTRKVEQEGVPENT